MSNVEAPWDRLDATVVTVVAGTMVATLVGCAGSLTPLTWISAVSSANDVGCVMNVASSVVELT